MAKKNEKETNQAAGVQQEGTQAEGAVMDQATREKFQQKLKELLAIAKKKKNMLENYEISDFFKDMHLDAEQLEKVLEYLEANGVDG